MTEVEIRAGLEFVGGCTVLVFGIMLFITLLDFIFSLVFALIMVPYHIGRFFWLRRKYKNQS